MVGHAGTVYVDVTLTRSKVKVKVMGLLNFQKLAKPCMHAGGDGRQPPSGAFWYSKHDLIKYLSEVPLLFTFHIAQLINSWHFCNRDAAENGDGIENSVQRPVPLNSSINKTRGQSAALEEVITTESAAASAAVCDLELTETEEHRSTSDNTSLRDHQYAVLFHKHVQERPFTCNLCDETFDLHQKLERHLVRFHKSKRQHPPVTDEHSQSAVSHMATERAQNDSVVDDTTIEKMNVNKPSVNISAAASLEAHMQSHRRNKQESDEYMCDMCGMMFGVRWKFLKHVIRNHSGSAAGGTHDNESDCVQQESTASAVAARTVSDIRGYVRNRSINVTSQAFLEHVETDTGEKLYNCRQCSQMFTRKKGLRAHELLHADVGRFRCQHCAQSFHYKNTLFAHIYKKHGDKLDPDPGNRPFSCRFCGERFYTASHLRGHVDRQHQSAFCEMCGKTFYNYSLLQNHTCTSSGAFGCNICDMSYTSAAGLSRHLVIHKTEDVGAMYKCQWCSEQFELMTELESHVVDRHSFVAAQYHCSKCDKSFISETRLKRHISVHTEPAFVCSVCGRKFAVRTTLMMHTLTHSAGGQYQCNHCEKSFHMESTLKLHMRLHSEDAFTCTVCDKKFMIYCMLRRHMDSHRPPAERKNAQRFGCAVCGKLFVSKQTLEAHELIHSGAKPYLCNTCGRAFRQRQMLTQHMQTHTGFKRYCCNLCSKAYSTRISLLLHSDRVHNVQLPVRRRFKSTVSDRQHTVPPPSCSEPVSV